MTRYTYNIKNNFNLSQNAAREFSTEFLLNYKLLTLATKIKISRRERLRLERISRPWPAAGK